MATQDNYVKTAFRLPPELHRELIEAAESKGRSLNAEIIDRLQVSGTAQAPDLTFLLARVEMRAAEAELDNIELKAMLGEVAWSLKAATLYLSKDQFTVDEKLSQRVAEWEESIADAMRYAGEFAEPETDSVGLAERKADELRDAVQRAHDSLGLLRRKRNEFAHNSNPSLSTRTDPSNHPQRGSQIDGTFAKGSLDLRVPSQGSSETEDPSPTKPAVRRITRPSKK